MSVQRSYAQPRTTPGKYRVALSNGTGFTPAQLRAVLSPLVYPTNQPLPSVVTVQTPSTFLSSIATTSFVAWTNVRDLGRWLSIQNRAGQEVYRFSLVLPINGATTEGVPSNYDTASLYVCTWSADPYTKVVQMGRV